MLLRVCSFSMAGENEGKRRSCQTVAVILILCSLVPSLTCFSLRWFIKKAPQHKVVSEAAVTEVRPGHILFNERELSSESGYVPGNDGLLHVDLDQTEVTGTLEQKSQLKDVIANEAAWRRLNATLHCGQTKMKLKAMGPGAADLQLDMGNARHLPLAQVPEICGYSLQQNALGLVLVIPYNGCNVIHEDGNHVVLMSWRETPVKLTCHMLPSPDSTPPKSAQHPWNLPFPHGPWSQHRHKRQANLPFNDPRSLYYPHWYYYMQNMRPTSTAAPSTTPKPGTTTTTTKPAAYPYNPYLLYYPYYYYYSSYYPLPTTTTTAPTTTTGPAINTTASTTKAPPKPSFPIYPPYYYYPYYYPMGQQVPGNGSEIYYYPVIQHFYGKPPYTATTTTTQPPNPTTEPTEPTEPTSSSVTTASTPTTPLTPAPTAQTTKPCAHTTTTATGGGVYPGTMKPYVPYGDHPFVPYVSMDEQKAGKLLSNQKYMPHAGYKSGPQARSYPHPSFDHWQPVPWFPHSAGQDIPPFDWNNLQP